MPQFLMIFVNFLQSYAEIIQSPGNFGKSQRKSFLIISSTHFTITQSSNLSFPFDPSA